MTTWSAKLRIALEGAGVAEPWQVTRAQLRDSLLFHATPETFEGPATASSWGGQNLRLLWTAEHPDVAQSYIMPGGVRGGTYTSLGNLFSALTSRESLDGNWAWEDHHAFPRDNTGVSIMRSMGFDPDPQYDRVGRVQSARSGPSIREIADYLRSQGYEVGEQHDTLRLDMDHPEDGDGGRQILNRGDAGLNGTLYVLTGKENLRLFDASTGEGDLQDPQYHHYNKFAKADADGYDGIIIDDFGQSPEWGNFNHRSIGLFERGVAKLTQSWLPVEYADVNREGDTPGFAQWHHDLVAEALSAGKQVPAEVLAEYPDLAGTMARGAVRRVAALEPPPRMVEAAKRWLSLTNRHLHSRAGLESTQAKIAMFEDGLSDPELSDDQRASAEEEWRADLDQARSMLGLWEQAASANPLPPDTEVIDRGQPNAIGAKTMIALDLEGWPYGSTDEAIRAGAPERVLFVTFPGIQVRGENGASATWNDEDPEGWKATFYSDFVLPWSLTEPVAGLLDPPSPERSLGHRAIAHELRHLAQSVQRVLSGEQLAGGPPKSVGPESKPTGREGERPAHELRDIEFHTNLEDAIEHAVSALQHEIAYNPARYPKSLRDRATRLWPEMRKRAPDRWQEAVRRFMRDVDARLRSGRADYIERTRFVRDNKPVPPMPGPRLPVEEEEPERRVAARVHPVAMAAPGAPLYHGTNGWNARQIASEGVLRGSSMSSRSMQAPMKGYAYLTVHPEEAIAYAMARSGRDQRLGREEAGLVIVEGADLSSALPDEDWVGANLALAYEVRNGRTLDDVAKYHAGYTPLHETFSQLLDSLAAAPKIMGWMHRSDLWQAAHQSRIGKMVNRWLSSSPRSRMIDRLVRLSPQVAIPDLPVSEVLVWDKDPAVRIGNFYRLEVPDALAYVRERGTSLPIGGAGLLQETAQSRDEGHEISYDSEGRKRWGRRAAGLLIVRGDGRILLVLRSGQVYDPNMWAIPGGRAEPGESEWVAALEESTEELGTLPAVRKLSESVYRSGDFSYTTFIVEMDDAAAEAWTPTLNWENTEWGWFEPSALPQPLHPGVAAVLSVVPGAAANHGDVGVSETAMRLVAALDGLPVSADAGGRSIIEEMVAQLVKRFGSDEATVREFLEEPHYTDLLDGVAFAESEAEAPGSLRLYRAVDLGANGPLDHYETPYTFADWSKEENRWIERVVQRGVGQYWSATPQGARPYLTRKVSKEPRALVADVPITSVDWPATFEKSSNWRHESEIHVRAGAPLTLLGWWELEPRENRDKTWGEERSGSFVPFRMPVTARVVVRRARTHGDPQWFLGREPVDLIDREPRGSTVGVRRRNGEVVRVSLSGLTDENGRSFRDYATGSGANQTLHAPPGPKDNPLVGRKWLYWIPTNADEQRDAIRFGVRGAPLHPLYREEVVRLFPDTSPEELDGPTLILTTHPQPGALYAAEGSLAFDAVYPLEDEDGQVVVTLARSDVAPGVFRPLPSSVGSGGGRHARAGNQYLAGSSATDMPEILYHGTSSSLVPSIEAEGLRNPYLASDSTLAADFAAATAANALPQTGVPFTFWFLNVLEKAPHFGERFGQNIEPAGRYMVVVDQETAVRAAQDSPGRYQHGEWTFRNPIVIPWGAGYESPDSWKRVLSDQYGGKTGKALSRAIVADGYDGIVTIDGSEVSECVDLSDRERLNRPTRRRRAQAAKGRVQEGYLRPTGGFVAVAENGGHERLANRVIPKEYRGWDWKSEPELVRTGYNNMATWALLFKGWIRVGRVNDPTAIGYQTWRWQPSMKQEIEDHAIAAGASHVAIDIIGKPPGYSYQSLDEFFEEGPALRNLGGGTPAVARRLRWPALESRLNAAFDAAFATFAPGQPGLVGGEGVTSPMDSPIFMAWAKGDYPDLPDGTDPRDYARRYVEKLRDDLVQQRSANRVRLFRFLNAPGDGPQIEPSVGIHWTTDLEGEVEGAAGDAQDVYCVVAEVPLDSVDWVETIRHRLTFPLENEVTLRAGAPLLVVQVERDPWGMGGGPEVIQDRPVSAIAGLQKVVSAEYPIAGATVDGRVVRGHVPNTSSIGSSLDEYKILRGIREVPMSDFDPSPPSFYSAAEKLRTTDLAEEIRESREIDPLIVVVDHEGPYILEGSHRFDALKILNAAAFPALVVLDESSTGDESVAATAGFAPRYEVVPRWLFHVTTLSRVPEIARSGLGGGSSNWTGFYGSYSAGDTFLAPASAVPYWYEKIENTVQHNFDAEEQASNAPILLRVAVRFIDPSLVENDELGASDSGDSSVRYKGTVPPDAIEAWSGSEWVELDTVSEPEDVPLLVSIEMTDYEGEDPWPDVTFSLPDGWRKGMPREAGADDVQIEQHRPGEFEATLGNGIAFYHVEPWSYVDEWTDDLAVPPLEHGSGLVLVLHDLDMYGSKGQGLGRKLFQRVVEHASALGAKDAVLEAVPASVSFWTHMGFEAVVQAGNNTIMRRSLALERIGSELPLTQPQVEALALQTCLREQYGLDCTVSLGNGQNYGVLVVEGCDLGTAREAALIAGVDRQVTVAGAGVVRAAGDRETYGGGHRPLDSRPPLHDLLEGDTFPRDVYERLRDFVHGLGNDSVNVVRAARGKPDMPVTVYRAVPPGTTEINTGDWIALSIEYARSHAAGKDIEYWSEKRQMWVTRRRAQDWPVLSATVPARDVRNGGNDLVEWGYFGPPIAATPITRRGSIEGATFRADQAVRDPSRRDLRAAGVRGEVEIARGWVRTDSETASLDTKIAAPHADVTVEMSQWGWWLLSTPDGSSLRCSIRFAHEADYALGEACVLYFDEGEEDEDDEEGGEVAGFIDSGESRVGYIGELDTGSKGQGWGRKLVETALDLLREQGVSSVYVPAEPQSFSFWAHMGFEDLGGEACHAMVFDLGSPARRAITALERLGEVPAEEARGITREEAFDVFLRAIEHVWGQRGFSFVRPVVRLGTESPPADFLAAVLWTGGRPMAIGSSLIRRAASYELRVADRALALDEGAMWRLMVHEAVHLGISQHGQEFRSLVREKGGAVSERNVNDEVAKILLQKKIGPRYQTIEEFDDERAAQARARALLQEDRSARFRITM